PDYGRYEEGRWPDDILDGRQLAFSHSWAYVPEEDRSQLRARILGGCSAHNACVLLEGAPSDYDWGPGWSYDSLEPYLRRAGRAASRRDGRRRSGRVRLARDPAAQRRGRAAGRGGAARPRRRRVLLRADRAHARGDARVRGVGAALDGPGDDPRAVERLSRG